MLCEKVGIGGCEGDGSWFMLRWILPTAIQERLGEH